MTVPRNRVVVGSAIAVLVALGLATANYFGVFMSEEDKLRTQLRARFEAEKAQRVALDKAREKQYPAEEKRLLSEVQAAIDRKNYAGAIAIAAPWIQFPNTEKLRALHGYAVREQATIDAALATQRAEAQRLAAEEAAAAEFRRRQEQARERNRPQRSAWDGSYYEVQRFVESLAHDPDSVEMAGCTEAVETSSGSYATECQFRGKNAFGAMVLQSGSFVIRDGEIVEHSIR